ncbi:GGDEF domain-containing protein [Vreelandella populi]|uniref:diguanylate cyclase n=1 Tax=Vreelandella populi TaxID=2498858 RepID=A0A3S0Z0N7_9GAMM|nr:GGDEF domain-containing protein [Halomonas populi]RUR37787.1 GGDEF domain-containing protein [Halomonas populi]RUR48696.1 GGDEF domain-containing protein [Halomonas populi]RUR55094.1 GGDEF domain-containing protein [Halomonas populi]
MYQLPYFKLLAQASGTTTVKERYDIDRHDQRLRTLRLLSILVTIFYFSYIPVDMYLLPDIGLRSVLLRIFVVGPLVILMLYYFGRPGPIRHKELASIITVSLATLIWCLGLLGTSDPRVLHYFYAGLVFQLALTIVLAHPFEYSVYASIFLCVCLYTIIWFLPGADAEYVTNHLVVGVPTVVLTLMANYRFSAESLRLYLQRVNAEELRAELALHNETLDKLSHIDPLTGLANRRGLNRRAASLTRSRHVPDQYVAVILIDVDHFKAFNDAYGHDAGDDCLRKIASALQGACGPQDTACRYGGEEFLVLHADSSNSGITGALLAERIRETVAKLDIAHRKSDHGHVTVSVGVCAGLLEHDEALTHLIKAADQALYAAKDTGRNRVSEDQNGSLADV